MGSQLEKPTKDSDQMDTRERLEALAIYWQQQVKMYASLAKEDLNETETLMVRRMYAFALNQVIQIQGSIDRGDRFSCSSCARAWVNGDAGETLCNDCRTITKAAQS